MTAFRIGIIASATIVASISHLVAAEAQPLQILSGFVAEPAYPSGVVEDADGSLYGTFGSGGPGMGGGLFRQLPDGSYQMVHAFRQSNPAGGIQPRAGLVKGPDGAFYGVTEMGGAYNHGTIFRWNGTELTVLHSFTGINGRSPVSEVIAASDGSLYGATPSVGAGAATHCGMLFKFAAGVLSALATFPCSGTGGLYPIGPLYRDAQGAIFGTTVGGGLHQQGTIFKWANGILTTLHHFNGVGGGSPWSGVIKGLDGALYGTTLAGGAYGAGTLFRWSAGTFTTLHSFNTSDGGGIRAGLVQDADGAIYGTAQHGMAGYGGIFRWHNGTLSIVYALDGSEGAYPDARLIVSADGRLVGSTHIRSSTYQYGGTLFSVTPGTGDFSSLTTFGTLTPAVPRGSLVHLSDGTIYGTSAGGGVHGLGTFYKRHPNGVVTTLHAFSGADGMFPNGVTRAVDGAIYGTTPMRGAADCGTLFKWIANGPLQTLHAFDCGLDGGEPAAPPIQSSDGALYGTTVSGGAHGLGTIYRWNGTALTTLHSFDGATGMHPYAGLIHGMDGALYGVASSGGGHGGGTVFKWFQGTITVLHSFDHSYAEGRNPRGALVQRADGSLVGTTRNGGPYGFGAFEDGYGTVFTLSDSTYTVAHNFSGNDGQHPEGNLTLLPDGTIVGTTSNGSPTRGSIFRFDGSVVTTLRSFNDHLITGEPPSGLILGSDENLIGSTMNAGVGGAGTLFRLLLNAAPILDSVTASASPIAVDSAVTIRATFTDAPSFRHTCTFAWNDGTPDTVAAASSGTCSASHAFDDAGVYTVSVSVTDGGGLSDTKASPFIVVYDPSAGFVTGDGWIQSPAGAYAALPGLEGRADFAFVSRYKKGASAPTGQTQFQFQIGSFNFASATYEWLVVAGGRAQFKGRGTVNGEGDYGFLLTATDGDANGGRGTDRFRIKIWDRVSAAIVYDNVAGAVDGFDSAVTQAIGGGSIVIHAK